MKRQVTTYLDGAPFLWEVEGDFAWGEGGSLFDSAHDILRPRIGDNGFFIAALPAGLAESARDSIARFLCEFDATPENYHSQVDDARHLQIISQSRELRLADLSWDGDELCRLMEPIVGAELSPQIADWGRDHVQVRINRPGSTDFNPPHRDGALSFFRNTVNFWIPICGCDERTRLPVAPGSHLIAESDCLQTAPRGAKIDGKTYNVPAIIQTRGGGDLRMIRPPVEFGSALVFTPFLTHGVGVNLSEQTRIALELRLALTKQSYPQRRSVAS